MNQVAPETSEDFGYNIPHNLALGFGDLTCRDVWRLGPTREPLIHRLGDKDAT